MAATSHIPALKCESAPINDKFTAIRTKPPFLRCTLPFTGWSLTCPAPLTDELLLAEKPSLRVSVKVLAPTKAIPSTETDWLKLWQSLDGLLLLPSVEMDSEDIVTSPAGRIVLDRRGQKRPAPDRTPGSVWQVVTARPRGEACLFFVLLWNWGTDPIGPADVGLFMKVMDSFVLAD